jgi:ribosome-associated protein
VPDTSGVDRAGVPTPDQRAEVAVPTAERRVRRAALAARDKRALDLIVLDVQRVSGIADYFLICSGRSTTHIKTIIEAIREELKAEGVRPRHAEGQPESGWVLLDYGDLVVHLFLEETRAYYALERLWGDVPLLSVEG